MFQKDFLMMGKRKDFNCIYCARPVTGRHHAIACDVSGEWQHRKYVVEDALCDQTK